MSKRKPLREMEKYESELHRREKKDDIARHSPRLRLVRRMPVRNRPPLAITKGASGGGHRSLDAAYADAIHWER